MSDLSIGVGALSLGLIALQLPATFLLLSRLLRGARRQRPIPPRKAAPNQTGSVSVVVPTLNEAHRIGPCLVGLSQQGPEVREIVVVDSRSTDGTQAKVEAMAQQDSRIRLVTDEPLPVGWVGRPWALHTGFLRSDLASQWVVGIDADTQPQPGLIASVLHEAEAQGYDIISLSPRFILETAGEWWLQPALLMTLIYRFDSAGVNALEAERVMANGQCFLSRRSVLAQLEGYACAASSFCDDVTLAREAARRGFKVGFLDGAEVISVRMYEGMGETWEGWGRSLDLKDATSKAQLYSDLWLLVTTQALPIPALLVLGLLGWSGSGSGVGVVAIALNLLLLIIRLGMQVAVSSSYQWPQRPSLASQCFWLAPLADPLAVLRIVRSAFQTAIQWRGRTYEKR
ncbi:MAG: 2'-O-glycosyltransferase CruG [Cyanobacteria bacterium J06648_16]